MGGRGCGDVGVRICRNSIVLLGGDGVVAEGWVGRRLFEVVVWDGNGAGVGCGGGWQQ